MRHFLHDRMRQITRGWKSPVDGNHRVDGNPRGWKSPRGAMEIDAMKGTDVRKLRPKH